jgi:hypothetical protein
MNIKIETDKNDIIDCGTIITLKHEDTIFYFSKDFGSLVIKVRFVQDLNKKEPFLRIKKIGEKILELEFANFLSVTGLGNNELLPIGFINNKKILFNYRVYSIKGIGHTLHYTFYLEKEGTYEK